MIIKIYNAENPDFEICVEGLNNPPDIGIINKVSLAINKYYEKKEFIAIGNKLEELSKGE